MGRVARGGARGPDAPDEIRHRLGGEKISNDPDDLDAARSDFAPMPGFLADLFSRPPAAVVRPATAREAAEAVSTCFGRRTTVVPRGGGTSGLGGAVPVRGGVVIDLTRLSRLIDIDEAKGAVTVEAGAVWDDVVLSLEHEGWTVPACPTSGAASTIGGWVSTGGYGAGTLEHGNFHARIVSLEVALPSGLLVETSGPGGRYSVSSFAGMEGQMGVVTRVTFPIVRAPEKRAAFAVALAGLAEGISLCGRLAALEEPPHWIEVAAGGAAGLYGGGWDGPVLLIAVEGTAARVGGFTARLKKLLEGTGLDLDSSLDVRRLWARKLSGLREGREERSIASGAVLVGAEALGPLVSHIMERRGGPMLECRPVDRATTLVTARFRTDRERLGLFGALARARAFVAAAVRMGGVPYGVGLWNSPYIDVILGGRGEELRRIKAEVDSFGIMNPGKFFSMTTRWGLRVPGWAARACFRLAGLS